MNLSKRGEYGLRAMMSLASQAELSQPLSVKEIALREKIPAKFLENILNLLKNAGLLHSKIGLKGGYSLAKPPKEIPLGQIIRILDGPLAPIRCVSKTAYLPCACPDEKICGLRMVMLDVRNAIAEILDNTSLADIVKRQLKLVHSKK